MLLTISKITPQKNKKNRYSLYSNEQFLIGISEEVLVSFGIYTGCKINDATLKKIKEKEYFISIRDQGLRFLSRRPHSIKELEKKLIRKGFKRSYISLIIDQFKQKDYLNDEKFSRILIKEEMKLKKNGPLLIKNKLIVKGIDPLKADKMIENMYDEKDQCENCQELAVKKIKLLTKFPQEEQKKKLAVYLKQKGYYWGTVQSILDTFTQVID